MPWKNTEVRYGYLSISLHWLMLALLVGVYACMELRELYPRGSDPREALKTWHYMLGLSVLALMAVRLFARWSGPTPLINPPLPAWQSLASKAIHFALYALMIGMPLAGWTILSAEGDPIPFWGLELPPLTAASEALAESVEEWHGRGAEAGYWLVGVHALAGLWHHYVQKDDTLTRMLPGRRG
jgi:superoxide oxidase